MKKYPIIIFALIATFVGGIVFAKHDIQPQREAVQIVQEIPEGCLNLLHTYSEHITVLQSAVDLTKRKMTVSDAKAFRQMDNDLAEMASEYAIQCNAEGKNG